MYLLLLWLAKMIQKSTRLFHNSGAALPGLVIERVYPEFLEKALSKLKDGVIVISGTNGKTTTTKLVADTLSALGERVLTNRSGSNMTRGLISSIVSESNLFGRLPYDVAVLEVDEAYSAVLSRWVPIRAALVLNVMRDQLDRFGEIDNTAKLLSYLTKSARELTVLNANDSRVVALPTKAKKLTFGVSNELIGQIKNDDQWHGGAIPKVRRSDVILEKSDGFEMKLAGGGAFETKLEGTHNHLNFAAAYCLIQGLNKKLDKTAIINELCRVRPAFGRGEEIGFSEGTISILLVKNPSSFMQTIKSVNLTGYKTVSVVINDALADSRDVSWLWDVELDVFKNAKRLICGGSRAYDMANRFKYSDIDVELVVLSEDRLIKKLTQEPGRHAVFCTYTAMMNMRKLLVKEGRVKQIK